MLIQSLYPLLRPLLFRLEPEAAHELTIKFLKSYANVSAIKFGKNIQAHPKTLMGIEFPNPVGLAAGLDKNGAYIDTLAALGFGFLEIGTVTPRAQGGNPKPRLFRLSAAKALINRMGFNNVGVHDLITNLHNSKYCQEKRGVLGINIGKNADTPLNRAAEDYLYCFEKVYPYASYVSINISSPNTQHLRQLQTTNALDHLLSQLKEQQIALTDTYQRYVPLALKIAPDLNTEQIKLIAALLLRHNVDAVIATNTTTQRPSIEQLKHAEEAGGLSGAPLLQLSNLVVQQFKAELGSAIPIIGVGGILTGEDAKTKIKAGADLIQIYTGLIYRGPKLLQECLEAFRIFQ